MPINLSLRHSSSRYLGKDSGVLGVWTNVCIPAGTRFGPVVGQYRTPEESKIPGMDRKYFWKIFNKLTGRVHFIRDGKDVNKANWMRHVQPAFREDQNLVAYQDGNEVYFLAIRQINRDEELLVWYGYDYAKRLGAPECGAYVQIWNST